MTGVAAWIEPDWPAMPGVRAAFSLRHPGLSKSPWDGLNLGEHVGDDHADVTQNRQSLQQALALPASPCWLQQVHGLQVLSFQQWRPGIAADGLWANQGGAVCAVMVADCLPILLRSSDGRCVAALHAGWRGLAAGIVEQFLDDMQALQPGRRWQAWLGPCIGPTAFEVGDEVRTAFVSRWPSALSCFSPHGSGHWLADLQRLAQLQLRAKGVSELWCDRRCTFNNPEQFFSFRRDSRTGRMAALIWLEI